MVTLLKHGVQNHDNAEGAIIQSTSVEAKCEESNTSGMVAGKTQIVRSTTHSDSYSFSVVGRGDLTMVCGSGGNSGLSQITTGQTNILTFKFETKLKEDSEWTYGGNNYPHAA